MKPQHKDPNTGPVVKQRHLPNQNQAWARRQIRRAVEALYQRGVPLAELNRTQQMRRCEQWMLNEDGKIKIEIPGTRSFERHLPGIVAEVLAGGS